MSPLEASSSSSSSSSSVDSVSLEPELVSSSVDMGMAGTVQRPLGVEERDGYRTESSLVPPCVDCGVALLLWLLVDDDDAAADDEEDEAIEKLSTPAAAAVVLSGSVLATWRRA